MQAWPLAHSVSLEAGVDGTNRLGELFDRHQPALYRLARRLSPTREDALDLVQDTFVRAARHLDVIPASVQQEEAWLVRVLVNLQRDRWRRQEVRDRHAREERARQADESAGAAGGAEPEDALVAHAIVSQALGRLTPRRRAIVVLHELDGRSTTDIARLLGISQVTVRWHLARGRHELAAWLRPLDISTGRMR